MKKRKREERKKGGRQLTEENGHFVSFPVRLQQGLAP